MGCSRSFLTTDDPLILIQLPDTRKVHDITWKWLSQHFFDILKHAEKEKSREKNEELGLESVVETLLSVGIYPRPKHFIFDDIWIQIQGHLDACIVGFGGGAVMGLFP